MYLSSLIMIMNLLKKLSYTSKKLRVTRKKIMLDNKTLDWFDWKNLILYYETRLNGLERIPQTMHVFLYKFKENKYVVLKIYPIFETGELTYTTTWNVEFQSMVDLNKNELAKFISDAKKGIFWKYNSGENLSNSDWVRSGNNLQGYITRTTLKLGLTD